MSKNKVPPTIRFDKSDTRGWLRGMSAGMQAMAVAYRDACIRLHSEDDANALRDEVVQVLKERGQIRPRDAAE